MTVAYRAAPRTFEDDWPRYLVVDVSAAIGREGEIWPSDIGFAGTIASASHFEIALRAGIAEARFSSFDERLNRAARAATRARAGRR